MRILVAYGSKMGSTKELAEWIGGALEHEGDFKVDVLPASEVRVVTPYDAVILGGALYGSRWHSDARRFVKRHRRVLVDTPTWLFSSGPLDDTASREDIPPVRFVAKTMDGIGARSHITFGGSLSEDAEGWIASKMAAHSSGDWRDRDHVREWAAKIAADLTPV